MDIFCYEFLMYLLFEEEICLRVLQYWHSNSCMDSEGNIENLGIGNIENLDTWYFEDLDTSYFEDLCLSFPLFYWLYFFEVVQVCIENICNHHGIDSDQGIDCNSNYLLV